MVFITLGVDSSSLQLRVNPEEIRRVYFLISKLIISDSERAASFLGPFYSSIACFSFLIMLLNRFLTLFSVRLLRSSFETSDHFLPFSIISFNRLKSSLSLHGPLKQLSNNSNVKRGGKTDTIKLFVIHFFCVILNLLIAGSR